MNSTPQQRDRLWRQSAILLGLVGLSLLGYSGAHWLTALVEVFTCFLMPQQPSACEAITDGRISEAVSPMSLYLALVVSWVSVRMSTDMISLWHMPKRPAEPARIAAMHPYGVLAYITVYHASVIGVFAVLGLLVPQVPYWLTVLFDLPVTALLEGEIPADGLYSGVELFLYIQALVLAVVALRLTRTVRNEVIHSPSMPLDTEDSSTHTD